ncbi:MAG: hypothetical protein ACKO39_03345, partial [Chthoniobacterales bacterium]
MVRLQSKAARECFLGSRTFTAQSEQSPCGEMRRGIGGVLQLRTLVGNDDVARVPFEFGAALQLAHLGGQLVATLRKAGRIGENAQAQQLPSEAPHVVFVIAGEERVTARFFFGGGKFCPPSGDGLFASVARGESPQRGHAVYGQFGHRGAAGKGQVHVLEEKIAVGLER